MQILQVSNFVSHHQLPLARQLASIVGVQNFRFCAVYEPDAERIQLGWNRYYSDPWIIHASASEAERKQYEYWWEKADVIICGERDLYRMSDRLRKGKIVFYMSERWWKPPLGIGRLLHPKFLKMALQFRRISKYPLFHYLPIGPFAESDIRILANLENRIWRWGYFTAPPELSLINVGQCSNPIKILWAGRMLKWKKVDTLIKALVELKRRDVAFELTLIGDGPERARLTKLAEKLLHGQKYDFRDSVSVNRIPEIMAQHDVYVFPSNAYEGWGAVVNEAMACGCVVVASKASGAAAAMIEDGVNGMVFSPGDWRELADKLCRLASSIELRNRLSNSAVNTIKDIWAPSVAAERFYGVSEALLENRAVPAYATGPMSRTGF